MSALAGLLQLAEEGIEYIFTALFDIEHCTQNGEEKGDHLWQRPGEGGGRKGGYLW